MSIFLAMIQEAIHYGMVFLFGSTGETLIEKSGHLNLGVPGIMCLGAVGGGLGAHWAHQAGAGAAGIMVVSLLMTILLAGAGGLLYGLFTITMRCNQNVTGLTLTTFGAGVLGFWGTQMSNKGITFTEPSRIAFTSPLFFSGEVPDNWFCQLFLSYGFLVYFAILIAIIAAVVLKHTRVGLSLRAVGENPAAADAAGINVIKYKYISCVVGAAIAGIGGTFFLMDASRGTPEYIIDAMGWLAVALVIFSLWRPAIGIAGSIVFGFLYRLPYNISALTVVTLADKELIKMIPYAVTALVLIVISFFNKRETQPPASLGVPYFREDR